MTGVQTCALPILNEESNEIHEMDLKTQTFKRVVLRYDLTINYFVPNKNGDRIIFINKSRNENFKGFYGHESKIWSEDNNSISNFSEEYWGISSDIIFPEDL